MLKVGSKFDTFDELSQRLEEFQKIERVQLWVRDSRTVIAAAKRARRKSLNPALKYAELTYSCVFGGRRPSDQTKVHNQTSAGGCPFKVRLSTSGDGQALIVKEICHNHNHEPGKKLHDEPRRLYKKTHHSRAAAAATTTATTDAQESGAFSVVPGGGAATNNFSRNTNNKQPIKLIVSKHRLNSAGSPFANLQQLQQQSQHVPPLKLHLHTTVHHQHSYVKKEQPDQLTEVDIGPTPDLLHTPDHMYSMLDYHAMSTPHSGSTTFPFNSTPSSDSGLSSNSTGASLSNTPSSLSLSTTPSSSAPNTPNDSPDTSPSNSLSSGLDDPLNFNMPPSPISPGVDEEDERNLEPIYELSEYLEGGLASLPSVDSDELPLCAAANRPTKGSATQQQVRVATTTAGSMPSTVGSGAQLPVVRAHTSTAGGTTTALRLGIPSNSQFPLRSKTMPSSSGNIFINTEGALVKTVKAGGTSTVLTGGRSVGGGGCNSGTAAPNVHYNLVPNKLSLSPASGCKIAGKITIQQFLSGSACANKGVAVNTSSPTTTAASAGGNPHFIVGCSNSGAVSSSSCSSGLIGTPVTTVGCSLVSSAGPVRNYRAKIAKKPYGAVGGVLKVVRSDTISNSIEKTMDRLINTVTPNKINFVEVSNKLSGNKSSVLDQTLAPAARNLFSGSGGDSSDDKSSLDLGSMDYHSSVLPEMDKVISGGGLDADIKIKTELAEGVPDNGGDAMNQAYTIDRLPGARVKEENPYDDDTNHLSSVEDLSNLFVLDGLEPSLGGDIPITPESYFNAADMDNYDFYMF